MMAITTMIAPMTIVNICNTIMKDTFRSMGKIQCAVTFMQQLMYSTYIQYSSRVSG